jgi:hypothetical protein
VVATALAVAAALRSLVARPPVDEAVALEARRDASGRTLVYLLSDDNKCAKKAGVSASGLQRTLVLLFALEG